MMPINEQPNRLDQLRASTAPMPMGGNPTPLNAPPVGSMPSSPPAGGGGPQLASPAPRGADPMPPAEDNARLDELLNAVAGEEGMMPEEAMMEEAPMEIASGLADAAVSLAGSIPAAKAELESALAQLDAMEMAEGLA